MGPYLWLLGARIGPGTTIATSFVGLPTLLRVDRDAAIGYGATLRPWQVADGWVTVAPITIGEQAYAGANAVCEPGACPDPGPGPWTAPGAPVGFPALPCVTCRWVSAAAACSGDATDRGTGLCEVPAPNVR
ncbi:hypothetical protein [Streptomyces sp. NBC_01800]|uniref:hypothetical protein n=1 Tax=Streptomyces sp. NBC_01800 TaxID=2975945 RepID=UPI002DDADBA0|nr:hypothetical protein [Streptomyces sp. NBC_01800]WSA73161.1 hypothetical protein OIE65_43615 [Streptomyces sp. NBC_01800]